MNAETLVYERARTETNGRTRPSGPNNCQKSPQDGPYLVTLNDVQALSVLSPVEMRELVECEAIIAGGWQAFIAVGQALVRIRDQRLYRAQYDTFEAYCRSKWQYGRSHAYRLIGAAQVLAHLSPIGDKPIPTHEAQVRPLIGLTAEQAKEAWERAVGAAGGGPVTAKHVAAAVRDVAGAPERHTSTKNAKTPKADKPDGFQTVLKLLKEAEDAVNQRQEAAVICGLLGQVKDLIERARAERCIRKLTFGALTGHA